MTDTIGWGDVEVEPRPPRRSRRNRFAVWTLLALVVVGTAVAPSVKRTLADHAASWLQHTWAEQQALGDARGTVLETAVARMGPGDLPTYTQLLRAVDVQEVGRLTSLDSSVRDHRTWAADVSRAKAAAHIALVAEINDLRDESRRAAAATSTNSTLFVPSPFSFQTGDRMRNADGLVAKAVRAHHVHPRPAAPPRLTAAVPFLQRLARPTDTPLPLHLVVSSDVDGVVEWDLAAGSHRTLTTQSVSLPPSTFSVVNGQLLGLTDTQTLLVPLDGSEPRPLPRAYTFVPDGRGGLWRVDQHVAQRLAANGKPFGPVHRLPSGFHAPAGFNGPPNTDLVGIIRQDPNLAGPSGVEFELWDPDTGRTIRSLANCTGISSTPALAAYTLCDDTKVQVIDLHTGRTRSVRMKGGYGSTTAVVLSPDGAKVAVALGGTAAGDTAQAFAVADLRTGNVEMFPNSYGLEPIEWSPDGKTLVLLGDAGGSNELAYWQNGMAQAASIRLGVVADDSHVAVIR